MRKHDFSNETEDPRSPQYAHQRRAKLVRVVLDQIVGV